MKFLHSIDGVNYSLVFLRVQYRIWICMCILSKHRLLYILWGNMVIKYSSQLISFLRKPLQAGDVYKSTRLLWWYADIALYMYSIIHHVYKLFSQSPLYTVGVQEGPWKLSWFMMLFVSFLAMSKISQVKKKVHYFFSNSWITYPVWGYLDGNNAVLSIRKGWI